MNFELDPKKSAANKVKHGVDFEQAKALWNDEHLLQAPAKTDDEPRFLVIGRMDGKHWAAVCVNRAGAVRIISVRRARRMEVEYYESTRF